MNLTTETTASPRVLLVEDEPSLRELVTMALEELGANVTAVATADEGAAILAQQTWTLLLTDVRTPGVLDGLELACLARRQKPCLNIVVMSGYHNNLSAPLPPDVEFLAKPWSLKDFNALVSAQFHARQSGDFHLA
ncbi:response regulator [Pseudomonas fulva]|nr:response regulator [Pseudomonas fulva]MBF8779326.1 response regulator [Pseudomonas fulva]